MTDPQAEMQGLLAASRNLPFVHTQLMAESWPMADSLLAGVDHGKRPFGFSASWLITGGERSRDAVRELLVDEQRN